MKHIKGIIFVAIFFISMAASAQWSNVFTHNGIGPSCFATSKDTCFVTGGGGQIYRTTNGGISWDSAQTIFNYSWWNDIFFPSANIGYACGGTSFGPYASTAAKTSNAGASWDSITSNAFGYELYSAYFINDTVGFFGGAGLVVKTMDGGLTFSVDTLTAFGAPEDFYFTSADTGILVGGYKIARTTDQGQNWTVVFTDTTRIHSVSFISSNDGYAVGDKGALLKTIDRGITWSKTIIADDSTRLESIQFLNINTGYIAVNSWQTATRGYIFKSTDGGNSWTQQVVSANIPLVSVSMAAPDTGYASGPQSV